MGWFWDFWLGNVIVMGNVIHQDKEYYKRKYLEQRSPVQICAWWFWVAYQLEILMRPEESGLLMRERSGGISMNLEGDGKSHGHE